MALPHLPPYSPVHQFAWQAQPFFRVFFWFVLGLALLVSLLAIGTSYFLEDWSVTISEAANPLGEPRSIGEVVGNYRAYPLTFNVFRQKVTFGAGPIQPMKGGPGVFWLIQALAWGALLIGASQIKSRWSFLFFGLHALFIHFSGLAEALTGSGGGFARVLSFILILTLLATAYAFQANMIRAPGWVKAVVLMALHLGLFGAAWLKNGITGAHEMAISAYPYLTALWVAGLLFVGKEIPFLLVAILNHRRNPAQAASIGWIAGVLAGWLALLIALSQYYLGWGWADQEPLVRPLHLVLVALLVMPFTSQPIFIVARNVFSAAYHAGLIFAALALALIGFAAWQISAFDPVLVFFLNRLAVIFLGAGAFGALIYILSNFGPPLARRFPIFWALAAGPRFSIAVVFLLSVGVWVIAEGREGWKSFNLAVTGSFNHQADLSRRKGDLEKTQRQLELAVSFTQNDVKANYNLAALFLETGQDPLLAVYAYRNAGKAQFFAPALMNAANLLAFQGFRQQAIALLDSARQAPGARQVARLASNQALLWWEVGKADAAVAAFKAGLSLEPGCLTCLSNLSLLYLENGFTAEARQFAELSLRGPRPSAAVRANAFFIEFATGDPLVGIDLTKPIDTADYVLAYHTALAYLAKGDPESAFKVAMPLAQASGGPDARLLRAWLQFNQDSIELAVTEATFVSAQYPSHSFLAPYLMGVAFAKRGVPEMAFEWFLKAGEVRPVGKLLAAWNELDQGRLKDAQIRLSLLRVEHDSLRLAAAKELGLLLIAYGEEVFAQMETPLSELTAFDYLHAGQYADSLNRFGYAIENFRRAQALDTGSAAPYRELGRLLNAYRDTLALSTLRFGLQQARPDAGILLELARALAYSGQFEEARRRLQEAAATGAPLSAQKYAEGEYLLARRDSSAAVSAYLAAFRADILHTPSLLALLDIWQASGEVGLGMNLVSEALAYNQRNPQIWAAYAWFARASGMAKDAGFGAVKAITLTEDGEVKKALSLAFAAEIREALTQ